LPQEERVMAVKVATAKVNNCLIIFISIG